MAVIHTQKIFLSLESGINHANMSMTHFTFFSVLCLSSHNSLLDYSNRGGDTKFKLCVENFAFIHNQIEFLCLFILTRSSISIFMFIWLSRERKPAKHEQILKLLNCCQKTTRQFLPPRLWWLCVWQRNLKTIKKVGTWTRCGICHKY